MTERPDLNKNLDSKTFTNYYYLKEELVHFCKESKLNSTGSKMELTERIIHYLDTGEKLARNKTSKPKTHIENITLDTIIENNIVCSEQHRKFFKKQIGPSFSFNVAFQKWLKNNPGKTYREAINEYFNILEEKKNIKTKIDKQFEYNTYIRDFFKDNKDKNLKDAIICWKHKKVYPGTINMKEKI